MTRRDLKAASAFIEIRMRKRFNQIVNKNLMIKQLMKTLSKNHLITILTQKLLKRNQTYSQIINKTKVHPYLVKETINLSRNNLTRKMKCLINKVTNMSKS